MNFSIKLSGNNDHFLQTLFKTSAPLKFGDYVAIPGGATLIYKNSYESRMKGISEATWILELLIEFGKGVSIGLLVAWLKELINKNPGRGYMLDRQIIADRTEINFDEEKVKQIIYEHTEEKNFKQ